MLRLFGRKPKKTSLTPARQPRVPDGMRVYGIGDIHGNLDLLQGLLKQISADRAQHADKQHKLIFLGDYIDRGTQSRAVIEFLCANDIPGFDVTCLLGNHESTLLKFLTDTSIGSSWVRYGGAATLGSYGIQASPLETDDETFRTLQAAMATALPDHHLEFLRALEPMHREGDYLFVHAGVRPGVPIEEQSVQDLTWIREEFLKSKADHGALIVHGHSVTTEPEIKPNRIGIDTGAYMSGTLTCLVLEGESRWLIQT